MTRILILKVFIVLFIWTAFFSVYSVSVFFSDCQSNHIIHQKVVEQIAKHNPQYVFIGGDITQNGSRKDEFTAFFDVMKPLTDNAEIYPVLGNHDKDKDIFLKAFPTVDSLTYYVVEKDNIVWVMLNSNLKMAPGSPQYRWLQETLGKNSDRTIIVVMHHPVFSSGAHGDEKGFSFLLPSLFKKYSVAAVFSGHDHIYERSVKDGIQYIVFGGAGGRLYNKDSRNDYSVTFKKTHGFLMILPEGDMTRLVAYDMEGNVIEEVNIHAKAHQNQLTE